MNEKELPTCIGFIMDGNRRWAKEQGKESIEGHTAGFNNFFTVVDMVCQTGIPHAVFYAFSTENWNRSETEVNYLMELFRQLLADCGDTLLKKNVRVRIIGRRHDFGEDIQTKMSELEEQSAGNTGTTIWIALSYGGRAEIVEAVNRLIAQGTAVDESAFAESLWTAGMPDPDLVIRTGGEQRLSNFLPWQSTYSELFFTPVYWPAFTNDEFDSILAQYAQRQRRNGR